MAAEAGSSSQRVTKSASAAGSSPDLAKLSAHEWAKRMAHPLLELRAELRTAIARVREAHGDRARTSWSALVKIWKQMDGGASALSDKVAEDEYDRTVEMRWRRAVIDAEDVEVDVINMGQLMAVLHSLKDRLPQGEAKNIRRLLHGEEHESARLFRLLYPKEACDHDITGLIGSWRLTHLSSDSQSFIVWNLRFSEAFEPSDGPGAWFEMNTNMPDGPFRAGRRAQVEHRVKGAAHAIGSTFYLIGVQGNYRPVSASFQLSHDSLPGDRFDHAFGVIQRVGTKGVYAARALLRRLGEGETVEVGTFTTAEAQAGGLQSLVDDITTLSANAAAAGGALCLLGDAGFSNQ